MLDVHPPHEPTHTWKDFFIHIATIVVGLLIAVGIEQTVEAIHNHEQLEKARAELREDVDADDGIVQIQLQRIRQVHDELDEDKAILLKLRSGNKANVADLHFDWDFRRIRTYAWSINRQSGALDRMPHRELSHYAYFFATADAIMDTAALWQIDLESAKSIASRSHDGTLSAHDIDELLTAIAATEGALARTERLIHYAQPSLNDHSFDKK